MTKQLKSDLMLLLVVMFWGISYYLMDMSLSEMDPFTLNAFRFIGAFLIALMISFPKLKTVNRITIKYSLYIGIALIFVYIGATFGVLYTSLSNAGFLCALTVVFTPVLGFFFKAAVPDKKIIAVVIMCVIGIGLLTLNEQLKPAVGDILCLICAMAYSVDLLITETAVAKQEVNAYQLGVFQLGFAGIFNLILAYIFEVPTLPHAPKVWAATLFLAVFCTGIAFVVQAVAQQHTSATHVGVIFTLEPVIAGVVAYALAGEVLMPRAYLGGVILIAGLLFMEIDFVAISCLFWYNLKCIFIRQRYGLNTRRRIMTEKPEGTVQSFEELAPVLEKYGRVPGSLITILQKTQDIYGYLSMDAISYIALKTGIKPAKIYGVATFYTQFRLKPIGKNLIMLCQGTACHVNGSKLIEEAICEHLNIQDGETTEDNLFTLNNVACLGCCSLAPVMMIKNSDGDETYGNLTKDSARAALEEIKGRG